MIEIYHSIHDVPKEWDNLCGDNPYLYRNFLAFMEEIDPCKQKYHVIRDETGQIDTIFMTYERSNYNLAMFTRFNLKLNITMIYVPLSVTREGMVLGKMRHLALDYIKKIKGYKIVLNSPEPYWADFANGLTCPKCILTLKWDHFEDYLKSLRSNYRYRYQKALKKSANLRLRYLKDGSEFTDEMYNLYLEVYHKSRIKIECLSKAFFQGPFFKIFVLEDDEQVHGFVQLLENGSELIFEFVGIRYATNQHYDTYHRMLLEIIRYGIEHGFQTIDFGQTADDTKLKLGSKYVYLYAHLHHSNPLINWCCRKLAKFLSYRPITTPFRVFKEEV